MISMAFVYIMWIKQCQFTTHDHLQKWWWLGDGLWRCFTHIIFLSNDSHPEVDINMFMKCMDMFDVFFSTSVRTCWNTFHILLQDGNGYSIQSGWWFGPWILFFHTLGRTIPIDSHIFQRGWNHQPAVDLYHEMMGIVPRSIHLCSRIHGIWMYLVRPGLL